MKQVYHYFLILLVANIYACQKSSKKQADNRTLVKNIVLPAFQNILDSAKLKGSILIYDPINLKYYSNDFEWVKLNKLPASTFKIPNSIIALETKVVQSDSTIFNWDGSRRGMKQWEKDMSFREAFHLSCVPCYQEIARAIGVKRMRTYLDRFDYGSINVNASNIDQFWLQGTSRINQMEQIDFLHRFYNDDLPISKRSSDIMKQLMIIEQKDGYTISGKTGWSIKNEINNGWFVGQVKRDTNIYYFATNVEPTYSFDMINFSIDRKKVTYDAFRLLGIDK